MDVFVSTANPDYTMTLAEHKLDVRRLLHDSSGNFYDATNLTDWINEGRWRVVEDTGCYRTLQSIQTVAGQETYKFSTDFPYGAATFNVLNATLVFGSSRIRLHSVVWTHINIVTRSSVGYQGRPIICSQFGQETFYLNPIPDQAYTIEMDTVIMPSRLSIDTEVDSLLYPYTRAVKFWAAHLAKLDDQLPQEAEYFKARYYEAIGEIHRATFTRRLGI